MPKYLNAAQAQSDEAEELAKALQEIAMQKLHIDGLKDVLGSAYLQIQNQAVEIAMLRRKLAELSQAVE